MPARPNPFLLSYTVTVFEDVSQAKRNKKTHNETSTSHTPIHTHVIYMFGFFCYKIIIMNNMTIILLDKRHTFLYVVSFLTITEISCKFVSWGWWWPLSNNQSWWKDSRFPWQVENVKQFRFGGWPKMFNHFVGDSIFAWGILVLESFDSIIAFRHGEVWHHGWRARGVCLLAELSYQLFFSFLSSWRWDFDGALRLKGIGKEVCSSSTCVVNIVFFQYCGSVIHGGILIQGLCESPELSRVVV